MIALTAALAELLRRDGPWTEAVTRHAAALQSAKHLGDRLGQASALNDLGDIRRITGDYLAAARDLEQALAIFRDLGDRLGQANALKTSAPCRLTGDYLGAADGTRSWPCLSANSATSSGRPTRCTTSGSCGG